MGSSTAEPTQLPVILEGGSDENEDEENETFRSKRSNDKEFTKQPLKKRKENHPVTLEPSSSPTEVVPCESSVLDENSFREIADSLSDCNTELANVTSTPENHSHKEPQRLMSMIRETTSMLQFNKRENDKHNLRVGPESFPSLPPSSSPITNEILRLVNILSAIRHRYPLCFPSVCYRWHWLRVITASTLQDLGAYQVILSLNDSEYHSLRHQPKDENHPSVSFCLFPLSPEECHNRSGVMDAAKNDNQSVDKLNDNNRNNIIEDPQKDETAKDDTNDSMNQMQCETSSDLVGEKTVIESTDKEVSTNASVNDGILRDTSHIKNAEDNNSNQPSSDHLIEALLSSTIAGRVLGDLHFLFYSLSRGRARVSFLRAHSQAATAAEILQKSILSNDRTNQENSSETALEQNSPTSDVGSHLMPSNIDVIDPTTLSLYNIAIDQPGQPSLSQKHFLYSEDRLYLPDIHSSISGSRSLSIHAAPALPLPPSGVVLGRDAASSVTGMSKSHQQQFSKNDSHLRNSNVAMKSDSNNNNSNDNESVNLVTRAVNLGYWRLDPNSSFLPQYVKPEVLADAFIQAHRSEKKRPGRKPKSETVVIQQPPAAASDSAPVANKARQKLLRVSPKPRSGVKPGPKPKAGRNTQGSSKGGGNEHQVTKSEGNYEAENESHIKTEHKGSNGGAKSSTKELQRSSTVQGSRVTRKRTNQSEGTRAASGSPVRATEKESGSEEQDASKSDPNDGLNLYELLDIPSRAASLRSHHKKIKEFLELKVDGKANSVATGDLLTDCLPVQSSSRRPRSHRKASETITTESSVDNTLSSEEQDVEEGNSRKEAGKVAHLIESISKERYCAVKLSTTTDEGEGPLTVCVQSTSNEICLESFSDGGTKSIASQKENVVDIPKEFSEVANQSILNENDHDLEQLELAENVGITCESSIVDSSPLGCPNKQITASQITSPTSTNSTSSSPADWNKLPLS